MFKIIAIFNISVFRQSPFQVSESGYGSFTFPVDVYLKNPPGSGGPRKVRFQYELFLSLEGPVNQSRVETIVFQNPCNAFLTKLLKAKAEGVATSSANDVIVAEVRQQKRKMVDEEERQTKRSRTDEVESA